MLRLSSYLNDVMMQIRTCFMSEMCASACVQQRNGCMRSGRGKKKKVKLREMLPTVTYETNARGTESCSSAYRLTKDRVMLPN